MIALKTNRLALLVVGTVTLAGCGMLKKKQDPVASAAPTPIVAPTTPVATAPVAPTLEAPVTVADESVPAPEDFEDEAFEKVSDKTYKAELDTVKKELEAK